MSLPSQAKQEALSQSLSELGVVDSDCIIKAVSGQGKGGQKQNKTANCIYIKHIPTGIEVKCQRSRSKESNLFFAKRLLCEKIQESRGILSKNQARINKIRKQKKKRKLRSTQGEHGKD